MDKLKAEHNLNKRFAKFTFISTIFNYGSKFLLTLTFAKVLGLDDFGVYTVITATVFLFEKLCNPQIWLYLIKNSNKSDSITFKSRLISKSITYEIIFKLCAVITYYSFIYLFIENNFNLYAVAGIYIPIMFIGTMQGLIRLNNNVYGLLKYNISIFAINIIVVICVLFFQMTIEDAVVLFIVPEFFGLIVICHASKVNFKFILKSAIYFKFDKNEVKEIFHFHLNGMVRVLTREFDIIVFSWFFNKESVGVYKIAKQVSHLPLLMTDGLYNSIYASFCKFISQGEFKLAFCLFYKNIKTAAWISLVGLGGVVVVSLVLDHIYGTDDKILIISILLYLSVIVSIVTFPFAPMMNALNKTKELILINVAATIVYFFVFYISCEYGSEVIVYLSYLIYYLLWSFLCYLIIIKDKASV
ncbi:lipopolysaccharide biosynthesis protein [Vibrio cortegadensis]|uniref:Lipopolysaccharide biosynthesis protein n=1 Tax=Vibrio cortegadensis TaxID=1328770 RepID=A0ABV4M706_9VIBR